MTPALGSGSQPTPFILSDRSPPEETQCLSVPVSELSCSGAARVPLTLSAEVGHWLSSSEGGTALKCCQQNRTQLRAVYV